MATFELDDRDFPCSCAACSPARAKARANRKRRPPAPAPTILILELEDAFTTLRPNLIRAAQLQLQNRGLDEQLAEDLVQDAMARWWHRAPEYRGPRQLGGWLRKTIAWLASEGLRRRDLLDHRLISFDQEPRGRRDDY
jgi:hypothetical protein